MTDKQEEYRQLLDDINDGFLIIQQGRIVFANARWAEMVGYEHMGLLEPMSVPFTAFVRPEEQTALLEMHKRQLRGEVIPERYELTLTRMDGTSFYVELSAKVMEYQGQPAVSVLVRDITERKRVEEALQRSEQHLRSLIENALGPILIVNAIATIRYVSPSSERIFGYRVEDLVGKNIFEFAHPEDMSNAINVFTQGIQIPGHTAFLELRLRHKDGSWRVVELIGKNLLDDPAVAGVVLNYRDITERKQAEERIQRFNLALRAIRNVSQLITREKDRNKLLEGVCASLMVTRGYYNAWIALLDESGGLVATAEAGLGEDFLPLVERLKRGQLTNCGQKALRQPDAVTTQDPSSTCADCPLAEKYRGGGAVTIRLEYGEKIYGLLCVSIPADLGRDKEEQSLLSEVAMDIAFALHAIELEEERKRAEKKLEELYKEEQNLRQELEAEIKKRAEFNRALVHELKTPLATMLASSDMLIAHLQEGPPLRLARNVYKGAVNLNKRIGELLDLAKGEIGMLGLKPEPVDPLLLLRELGDDMALVASRHGQSLTLDLPPSLPMVWADEVRLRQVVLNLLSNACKFTPEGGKITLRAGEKDGTLMVEVQDTGPGISEEEQQRLFEPYYRVEDDRQRFEGLGLGLALCKTLVELHGGQIWVESHVGKGSTFSFSVPLEATNQQANPHGRLPTSES